MYIQSFGPWQQYELGKARMQRDKADVQAMVGQIKGHYQSPFDLQTVPSELVNIVTGLVASSDVEQYMSGFLDPGEAQQSKFVTERLSEGHTRSFWDTMPRLKTKTFADM
jgi:hypothetical protein